MSEDGNLYITALQYAENRLNDRSGVGYFELRDYLEEKGFKFNLEKESDLSHYRLLYSQITDDYSYPDATSGKSKFIYNPTLEAYFRLIEYKELHEARGSSKAAMTRSTIAIVLSVLSMVIATGISFYQINSPSKIHNDTIRAFQEMRYDDGALLKQIKSLESSNHEIVKKLDLIESEVKSANKSMFPSTNALKN